MLQGYEAHSETGKVWERMLAKPTQHTSSKWITCGTSMQTQGADFIWMNFGLKENFAQVNRWTNASFNICFYLHGSWEIYSSEVLLLQSLKNVGFMNLEACHTHTNNDFFRGQIL